MIVVGFDLSLANTGIAAIDLTRPHLPLLFTEGSPPPDTIVVPWSPTGRPDRVAPIENRADRIQRLSDRILADVSPLPIALAVIESPSHGSRFGLPHERGGLYWRVAIGLLDRGIPLAEVAPRQRAQYATGKGGALKPSVVAATVDRYQLRTRNDNVVDAFILAAMGARWLGSPLEHDLPEVNQQVIGRVLWPELERQNS